MGPSRADNSVKVWRSLPISNPKPDLYSINAHTKFGENPLMFTQVIILKRKTDRRMDDWRTDRHIDVQWETIIPCHYCVAGYKKKQKKPKKTRGPRAMACSPVWHSHCRYADVMQHFSNPIIATNEKIIIWAVLSFEEEYYLGLTVNGAWSFEQTINHISTGGSMWNLVEIGFRRIMILYM